MRFYECVDLILKLGDARELNVEVGAVAFHKCFQLTEAEQDFCEFVAGHLAARSGYGDTPPGFSGMRPLGHALMLALLAALDGRFRAGKILKIVVST